MAYFPQVRTHRNEIFPFPTPGETVLENPPCLIWLADEENKNQGYQIVLKNEKGERMQWTTCKTHFRLPKALTPGCYEWNVLSGDRQRGWQSFILAENAVEFVPPTAEEIYDVIPASTHPRALFEAREVPEILALRAKELEILTKNIAVALADGIPQPPYLENPDPVVRYHHARAWINTIRDFADRNLIACALGWQLLQDDEAGKLGKHLLLELASWNLEDTFVSLFYPHDEVGLSLARTLPSAFDLLYDLLDEKEREQVVGAMATIAEQCHRRIVDEDYENHPGASHTGRLPAYLGEAALMLKGFLPKEKLLEYLGVVTDIYGGSFPHYGSPDGGWGEGAFYASSYTKWYLPFFLCVERYTGKSYLNRPFYQNLSNFFLHFADPDFESHPFGDGYWCHSEDGEWPGFFAQDPFRVYADKFGPAEAVAKQRQIPQPEIFRLHLLDIFLPHQKAPENHITKEAQLAAAFPQTGVFSMRTSFAEADCMAVIGRASRFGAASHSHADQGSFALFYKGVSLISPSGYYGAGWSTDHHQKWTKQTKAHNTILVDGQGMLPMSAGQVKYAQQEGNLFAAELSLDDVYESLDGWARHFTMDAASKTLIVEDTISSEEPHELQWLLHSLSAPVAENEKITIVRKGICLRIEPLEGLLPVVEITNRFDTDLNAGSYGDSGKYNAPPQYHMKWRTENAKKHKISVKFTIWEI